MVVTLIVLFVLLMTDIVTKYLAETKLTEGVVKNLIPNFLDVTLAYNKGAAWSMLSDATVVLAVISLIASIVLVYFILKNDWHKKRVYSLGFTLLLAGTFGNMIDRFFTVFNAKEGVVDMIILKPLDALYYNLTKLFGNPSSFPIFNLADSYLVVGIVLISIDILFLSSRRS